MTDAANDGGTGMMRRRLIVLVPLVIFFGLAAVFMFGLSNGDPSLLPSALIGKPAPHTDLPPVAGLERNGVPVPGLDVASFKGAVTLVNVWASWCLPCHEEVPMLMALAREFADSHRSVRIVGINYKDDPGNARRFLGAYGDPYSAVGADRSGRAGIQWGVYGVPENFVVGRDGRIAYKLVGPITPGNLETLLLPQIDKALAKKS